MVKSTNKAHMDNTKNTYRGRKLESYASMFVHVAKFKITGINFDPVVHRRLPFIYACSISSIHLTYLI